VRYTYYSGGTHEQDEVTTMFSLIFFYKIDTITLSFIFDKYYPIIN